MLEDISKIVFGTNFFFVGISRNFHYSGHVEDGVLVFYECSLVFSVKRKDKKAITIGSEQ